MSQQKKFAIKIVRGKEIRLMHLMPSTWVELQVSLKNMYGTSDFHITYIDEEGDHITISSDMDLSEAYKNYNTKPSIKIYIKPRNIIKEFEDLKIDEPFQKSQPSSEPKIENNKCSENIWGRFRKGGMRGRCHGMWKMFRGTPYFRQMKEQMKNMWKNKSGKGLKDYKIKVIKKGFPKNWVVSCGNTIVITWSVMNKGIKSWTEGSVIEDFKGPLKLLEPVVISEVKPGEVCNFSINVQVPIEQGMHKGCWVLLVDRECAGILRAKIIASAETKNLKVDTLVSMGFNREIALKALKENNGDLNLAVSKIIRGC
ncbi:hypothetical protein SteCoe_5412 [Stentor coeruleus]|uniref:PB1 domain-containing protein n=1 Tax=Stentor coeruleus TaxID=5963 RepID=A0A1R2CSL9_9CILI|nr:hypothetical protein SteCoe_5412 [Stentor coeruleus]